MQSPVYVFCAAAIGCAPVAAANIAVHTAANGDVVLSIKGTIMPHDGAAVLAAIDRHQPLVVEIAGPGGDFLSATQIGVAIKTRAIATHATSECLSSCAYVWMAGDPLVVDEGVTVDIHLPVADNSISYAGPAWLPYALHGWYLGRLGVSEEMMEAFYIAATDYGRVANRSFDMLAFARNWNGAVLVVPPSGARAELAPTR